MSAPAVARDAASVVLVRQADTGIEAFLIRRVPQMAFAPGFTVFPGGGVDPSDRSAGSFPGSSAWAARLGAEFELAAALGWAAARELFEECGVLLSGAADPERSADARAGIVAKELLFSDFLTSEGFEPPAAALLPFAHWITPTSEPRRFDTTFFLAVLPEGQEADGKTSESAESKWLSPAEVLDPGNPEPCLLLPPTWSILRQLAEHDRVADIVAELEAQTGQIDAIMPRAASADEGLAFVFPGDREYAAWLASLKSQR